jgi:hypothetical protein
VERVIEISCVELNHCLIICVYRPPASNFDIFETTLEEVLRRATRCAKPVIICGDFNIDILKNTSERTKLINLFKCFNLCHLFSDPTRITATSKTCIDNIFCNYNCESKHIISYLRSDHTGQMATWKLLDECCPPSTYDYRPITDEKIQRFRETLEQKRAFSLHSRPKTDQTVNSCYTE